VEQVPIESKRCDACTGKDVAPVEQPHKHTRKTPKPVLHRGLRNTFFIIGRKRWGATPPRDITPMSITQPLTLFIHHTADSGTPGSTLKADAAYLRGIQRFHKSMRGWSDIAYNFVICHKLGTSKKARVYEGRGLGVVGAATYGHNSTSISVCIAGNFDTQNPSDQMMLALQKTIKRLKQRGANIVEVKFHSDVYPTSCCGKNLKKRCKEMGIV